ncbi:MAG: DUF2165 domain-containing protein [Xanthomonadaceae bacterium]|nr:DUF2165 domain-containing protein [Xanthomonadaceae bacterium]
MIEIIVATLVAFLALHHLIYAIQNLFNLEQAYNCVEAVFGQREAPLYPRSMMPPVRSPVLLWAALTVIIAAEFAAGLALAVGAVQMFMAGGGSPADFAAATEWAQIGCGITLLIWFGLFLTIASAMFQMWQIELGPGAMQGAFHSGVFSGLVMLILLFLPTV